MLSSGAEEVSGHAGSTWVCGLSAGVMFTVSLPC